MDIYLIINIRSVDNLNQVILIHLEERL